MSPPTSNSRVRVRAGPHDDGDNPAHRLRVLEAAGITRFPDYTFEGVQEEHGRRWFVFEHKPTRVAEPAFFKPPPPTARDRVRQALKPPPEPDDEEE